MRDIGGFMCGYFPMQIMSRIRLKGVLQGSQLEHKTPQGENITLDVVFGFIPDFRGKIIRGPNLCFREIILEDLGHVHIPDLSNFEVFGQKDVCRLDVSMYNIFVVEIFNSLENLNEEPPYIFFRYCHPKFLCMFYLIGEVSASHVLQDNPEFGPFWIYERFEKFNNIRGLN